VNKIWSRVIPWENSKKNSKMAPWVGNIPNKYFFVILDTILRKKVFYGIAVKFQLFFIEQFEFFDGF